MSIWRPIFELDARHNEVSPPKADEESGTNGTLFENSVLCMVLLKVLDKIE